jgi:hypothetical protein
VISTLSVRSETDLPNRHGESPRAMSRRLYEPTHSRTVDAKYKNAKTLFLRQEDIRNKSLHPLVRHRSRNVG